MNVLLVDDHPMFRWGVRQFVASLPGFKLAGEASDGNSALSFVQNTSVDVILLDLEMPGLDGAGFLAELKKNPAKPKIIILSQTISDSFCRRLQAGGIDGYVLKTEGIDEISKALAALSQSEMYFSPGIAKRLWDLLQGPSASFIETVSDREREVARLVSQGLSTQLIADNLGCAVSTVKTHRANLMRKIGAKNVAEVVRWFTNKEGFSSKKKRAIGP